MRDAWNQESNRSHFQAYGRGRRTPEDHLVRTMMAWASELQKPSEISEKKREEKWRTRGGRIGNTGKGKLLLGILKG